MCIVRPRLVVCAILFDPGDFILLYCFVTLSRGVHCIVHFCVSVVIYFCIFGLSLELLVSKKYDVFLIFLVKIFFNMHVFILSLVIVRFGLIIACMLHSICL